MRRWELRYRRTSVSAIAASSFSARDLRYFRLKSRPTSPMPAWRGSPWSNKISTISDLSPMCFMPNTSRSTTPSLAGVVAGIELSVSSKTDVGDHSPTDLSLNSALQHTHRRHANLFKFTFLPHAAVHKCGLCCRAMSVCPSLTLVYYLQNFFHHPVATLF